MYTVQVITPPSSEPVSTDQLKSALRLNTSDEDSLLPGFITTARLRFEQITQRCVMTTVLRQYVENIPGQFNLIAPQYYTYANGFYYNQFYRYPTIYLMKGDVQSVQDVKYYDNTNTLQTSTKHTTDIVGNPAKIYWIGGLPSITTQLSKVAYVDFTAGWTTVPSDVCTAILLLACHYFEQREAYTTDNLKEVPEGFHNISAQYALGLKGSYRQ